VREHTIRLETKDDAGRFHQKLIDACLRTNTQSRLPGRSAITIAVVGGGATGVELCAELHNAVRVLASYGLDHVDPNRNVRIVLIEAGPRIPARVARAAFDRSAQSCSTISRHRGDDRTTA
jgi:NADH dehydrogenase